MQIDKERIIRRIEAKALQEAEHLSGEFARAASAEREEILAAMEVEQWLVDACQDTWPASENRTGC